MQTLAQFKENVGLTKIQLMQGEGKRKFAPLPDGTNLYVGKNTDIKANLFVLVNDGTVNPALKGSLWLVNSKVSLVELI